MTQRRFPPLGRPAPKVVQLGISRVDGKVRLRFLVQDGPPANWTLLASIAC